MEELFPNMMQLLKATSKNIDDFTGSFTDEKWQEYFENLSFLHTRLMQLNIVLHVEFIFSERLIPDIINYTAQLQEVETECSELVYYIFSAPQIFGDYGSTKYDALFMEEVLNGIIYNSSLVNGMLDISR